MERKGSSLIRGHSDRRSDGRGGNFSACIDEISQLLKPLAYLSTKIQQVYHPLRATLGNIRVVKSVSCAPALASLAFSSLSLSTSDVP